MHLASFGIDDEKEQQNPIGLLCLLFVAADLMSARAISEGSEGSTALHLLEESILLAREHCGGW